MKLTGRIDNPTEIAMNIVASSQDGKTLEINNKSGSSGATSVSLSAFGFSNNECNEGIIELHAPIVSHSGKTIRHRLDQKPLDQTVIVKAIKKAAGLPYVFSFFLVEASMSVAPSPTLQQKRKG